MNTNLFVVYILSLTFGLTFFYAELKEYFSPLDQYQNEISHLKKKVKEERFQHLLTSYEFQDFRQHIATLLPKAIQEKGPGEKSYPLRTLASVVQKRTNENLAASRAKGVFEEGKTFFRKQNYQSAIERFHTVVKEHPYSVHVPEALFLLVESHFVLRRYEECVHYANKMLDVFPESELTGYAMLRLGKIYEMQDRHDDAIEIYKTVIKTFPDRSLAGAADHSLRNVEL